MNNFFAARRETIAINSRQRPLLLSYHTKNIPSPFLPSLPSFDPFLSYNFSNLTERSIQRSQAEKQPWLVLAQSSTWVFDLPAYIR